jgi:hypothetical protein
MKARFLGVAAQLGVGVTSVAHANTVLIDQQQLSVTATTGFLSDVQTLAQTFTVGVSGELSSIEIVLAASSPITLNLLQTSLGAPTSSILATAVANAPSSPGLTNFDFTSSHILVHAGEVLAFQPFTTVIAGQVLGIDIAYGGADPYTGGELFQGGANSWQPFISLLNGQRPIGGVDAAFTTYVDSGVPAVPLPAAFLLFASGVGVMGLLGRRRRVFRLGQTHACDE